MTGPHVLFGQMLEFNFLPSRTLHASRYDTYALPGLRPPMPAIPSCQAAWHRHWSKSILRMLNVGVLEHARYPELVFGLMSPSTLTTLARRVGVLLCGTAIRHAIRGEQVRAWQSVLGDELLTFARRDAVRLDAAAIPGIVTARIPDTLHELESSGYATLLASLSQSTPAVLRRVELKLPVAAQHGESPLPVEQAWQLCLTVLKDMDPAWCLSFPAAR